MAKTTKKIPNLDPQKLQSELIELKNKYARALADYQNLEKRTKESQSQFVRLANAGLVTKLLTIIDNLETAGKHLNDPGLNLIISELKTSLESEGVTTLDPVGQSFNPSEMECIDSVAGPVNQVMAVTAKGYKLGDYLLRPAKVKVGTNPSQSGNNPNNQPITEPQNKTELQN